MFAAMRQIIARLDRTVPIYEMKTLDRQLDETLSTERLIAFLSAVFGGLATLMAALGLYGVMAFTVARRTNEIGLRLALGADQASVLWMVLRGVGVAGVGAGGENPVRVSAEPVCFRSIVRGNAYGHLDLFRSHRGSGTGGGDRRICAGAKSERELNPEKI
jgi:hypothetical protein